MKNFKQKESQYGDIKQHGNGQPTNEGHVNDYISQKALKDLPKTSITWTADPYAASLPNVQPYPILNVANKKIGGSYVGIDNLDGGNVQQYANSYNSGFLAYPDAFVLNVGINYRYLPVSERKIQGKQVGQYLVDNVIASIGEVTSRLDATTFTNLRINNYVVETSLPMGVQTQRAEINLDETTRINVVTDLPSVLYSTTLVYQLILQNYALCFNNHNAFKLKMGETIRMEYQKNTAKLNAYYGLLNKKSFTSLWQSMALNLHGEYVDYDFMKQVNTMLLVPSRKSESIVDPLLEINGLINMPTQFKLYYKNGNSYEKVFDIDDMTNFMDNIKKLANYLTAENTLEWVRGASDIDQSDQDRFKAIVRCIEGLNDSLNYFKNSMTDVRTVFDVLGRSRTNNWSSHLTLGVTPYMDIPTMNNLLVDDIYKLSLFGATEVQFNNRTKRFTTFSVWNIYSGIPEYDAKSGGAFLTFSLKDIIVESDEDNLVGYIPIGLTTRPDNNGFNCYGVTRDGHQVRVRPSPVTMADDPILARLVPLQSQSELKINIPTFVSDNETNNQSSCITRSLLSCLGAASDGIDTLLDPDILAIYQTEIADFTNQMIGYARSVAPFKTTDTSADALGFLGNKVG